MKKRHKKIKGFGIEKILNNAPNPLKGKKIEGKKKPRQSIFSKSLYRKG